MIDFKMPQLTDRAWADPLLDVSGNRGCEYNFTNLFVWSRAYEQCIAKWHDFMMVRLCTRLGCSYLFPAGSGSAKEAVDALREEAKAGNMPLRLVSVNPNQCQHLEQMYPGCFTFQDDRDGYDYLYDINRLADLGGKKLHSKRNHIHRFEEAYPDWVFEPITPSNLDECLEMDRAWYQDHGRDDGEGHLGGEGIALRSAIGNYLSLGMEGGLIRTGGKVVAFTMGDRLTTDTYDVHFEKAYANIQGAYAIINREFARYIRDKHPGIHYLNREDDMGVEGLRRAKGSYYPDLMVEKCIAIWDET